MGIPEPDPTMKAYWEKIIDRNGVDLAALRANLALTPLERLRQADARRKDPELRRAYFRMTKAERDEETLNHLLAIKQLREVMKQTLPSNS